MANARRVAEPLLRLADSRFVSPCPQFSHTAAARFDLASAVDRSSGGRSRRTRGMARSSGAAASPLPLLLLIVLGGCCAAPPVVAAAAAAARLSTLGRTLVVEASPKAGQVVHAGEDTIAVTWRLNASSPAGADAGYRAVRVTLCYAPASQRDRGWRKASDDLSKDKACQREIAERPYAAGAGATVEYRVARDVPTASYYVRAYALDASGAPAGYGQTAPGYHFDVAGVTGIHASLRVAAGVLSAFSIAALAFLLAVEKRGKDV